MTWDHLESEMYKLQREIDKNLEERKWFEWTQQRNIKKDKIDLEINNKLEDTQSRKESNNNLIKGIKKARKPRKQSDINK